ncbi:MAG TPA: putative motility protein [Holophagaceae bacterium]|nr:putative motility protein [Holophagaceae bacterium]
MDVSPASVVATQQRNTQMQYATSVLRKAIDIQAEQGAALAKLVAEQAGVGQRVDQYA